MGFNRPFTHEEPIFASPSAPIPKNGDALLPCPRCSADNSRDAAHCAGCGSFLPANQDARKTGIYSRQPPPADLRQQVDALRAGIIADRGGASELSALEHAYIEKLGDIDTTIRLLTLDIAANGLLTPGGKVRHVYDRLLAGLAAFDRYATRIGLERRSKRVSLDEIMREHAEDR
jgi:hypothetical protein